MDLFVKELSFKGLDAETRSASFVASTEAQDADGDIVEQTWRLERYKRNPVVLFAHDNRSLPIGKASNVEVKDGQLVADITFASAEANPLAENVWKSVQEGTLRAVSVGFRPHQIKSERRDDKDVYLLGDNELYEISVVPIPSNPEALARMKALAIGTHFDLTPPWEQDNKTADGGTGDKEMEIEEIQKELSAEKAKVIALQERCATLDKAFADEREKVKAYEIKEVEGQVDVLIGKKIAPTEKAGLLKLAGLDRGLFDEQLKAIADRPDMHHVKTVVGPDPNPNSLPAAVGDNGAGFEALVGQIG